jgi:hypothetical protein
MSYCNRTIPCSTFPACRAFDAITPEHVTPAIEHLIAECRGRGGASSKRRRPVTWDNFVAPLEDATEKLGRAWGIVNHLNNVVDTPELRAAYNENQPKVTEFWTALAQNEALFAKYKALQAPAPPSPACRRAQEDSSRTRCAISASAAPNCRRQEGALRRHPGTARRRLDPLLGKRARRHQRLQAAWSRTKPTWPACPTM